MQNRYVADIGDFGKFQLFRYLFNGTSHTLSQIWFLHPNETHNNDGKYIDYFSRIKGSDSELEAIMIEIIQEDKRHVRTLEEMPILERVQFFYPHIPTNYHDRSLWLKEAIHFTKSSNIIAVAPDNGMALKCQRNSKSFSFLSLKDKKSTPHKYIFLEEIEAFYSQTHVDIMIVYQHLSRCFAHDAQIAVLKEMLEKEFGYVLALKHRPYSPRVFFFLVKKREAFSSLQAKLQTFSQLYLSFWKLY